MNFNFCSQTPNVAFLLQVCVGVLPNLNGDEKRKLELAIRSFEEVTTVAEMTASSVISAAKGELLARAEVRDVLDVAAAMVRREATLNVDLSAMVQKVVEGRPGPETMQVRELAATPGSAWLLIDVRKNGSYGLSAGMAMPRSQSKKVLAVIRKRVTELTSWQKKSTQGVGSSWEQLVLWPGSFCLAKVANPKRPSIRSLGSWQRCEETK